MANVIEDIQVRDGRGGGEEVVGGSLEEHVIFRRIEGWISHSRQSIYKEGTVEI